MITDYLVEMLNKQEDLEYKLGYDFRNMDMAERVAFIKEYTLHTEHELHEMLAELPYFKPWKKYPEDICEQQAMLEKAQKEFIDVLHFFMNIALALGLSAEDMYLMYAKKNKINHERQEDAENYKPCVSKEAAE